MISGTSHYKAFAHTTDRAAMCRRLIYNHWRKHCVSIFLVELSRMHVPRPVPITLVIRPSPSTPRSSCKSLSTSRTEERPCESESDFKESVGGLHNLRLCGKFSVVTIDATPPDDAPSSTIDEISKVDKGEEDRERGSFVSKVEDRRMIR